MELIAIPNGLAECKRKIEFDRCRWERRGGRKDESSWSPRCGTDGGLIGWIRIPFVGGKKNSKGEDIRERRDSHRKEGRKKERNYLVRKIESTRQKLRDIPRQTGWRLRAFGDNYRHVDSISIGYHAPRVSRALSIKASLQSLNEISALSHR